MATAGRWTGRPWTGRPRGAAEGEPAAAPVELPVELWFELKAEFAGELANAFIELSSGDCTSEPTTRGAEAGRVEVGNGVIAARGPSVIAAVAFDSERPLATRAETTPEVVAAADDGRVAAGDGEADPGRLANVGAPDSGLRFGCAGVVYRERLRVAAQLGRLPLRRRFASCPFSLDDAIAWDVGAEAATADSALDSSGANRCD